MKPIEEIADVLGKAKRFCASTPADDERQKDVRVVNDMCELILFTLRLRVTPNSDEASEAIGLLRLMVGKLAHYLTNLDATMLAQKLLKWEQRQSETQSKIASKPRKDVTTE